VRRAAVRAADLARPRLRARAISRNRNHDDGRRGGRRRRDTCIQRHMDTCTLWSEKAGLAPRAANPPSSSRVTHPCAAATTTPICPTRRRVFPEPTRVCDSWAGGAARHHATTAKRG
jgi:hypothetical protein